MKASPLRTLLRRRDGNVTLLLAGGMTMLLGSAVLGIDTATLFVEKRRLQGVADAAALAAAADIANATQGANTAAALSPGNAGRLTGVTVGRFTPDAGVAATARFVAGAVPGNAARVTMESRIDPVFARIFGRQSTRVSAQATAARIDLAAFSIGSRLASVQGGLPGAILSTLSGSDIRLSAMDYNQLAGAQVDLLRMAELLRTDMGLRAVSFGDVLDGNVTLPRAVTAMAGATRDSGAAALLRQIATKLPNRNVRLDSVVDLGPLANSVRADPARPVDSDAYQLLRETLLISGGDRQVRSDIDLGIPGIGSTKVWLEIGERPANSPWLSIDGSGKQVVRTAQARLWIDVQLVNLPLGLAAVRVPLYVELAEAKASMASVGCQGGRSHAAAALDVTPSIGRAALADLDPATLGDFQRPVALSPARLVTLPLASVTGFADVRLGGTRAQRVTFTASDIEQRTIRTVSTNDLAAGVASSLLRNVDLQTKVLGLGLGFGGLTQTVGSVLSTAAPALDLVVNQVTALAGVHLGEADVRVNGVRCGTPMLVA